MTNGYLKLMNFVLIALYYKEILLNSILFFWKIVEILQYRTKKHEHIIHFYSNLAIYHVTDYSSVILYIELFIIRLNIIKINNLSIKK